MRPTPGSPVRTLVVAMVAAGFVAVGPAAEAAPVFGRAALEASGYVSSASGDCTTQDSASPDVDDREVVENGPAVTVERSSTATTTNTADPSDVVTSSSGVTVTASVSSVGGDPGSMDFDAYGAASLTPSAATSECWVSSSSYALMEYEFLVTRGGFLTVTISNRGDLASALSVGTGSGKREGSYDDHNFGAEGGGLKIDSTATIYLPPGEYSGYLQASVNVNGTTASSLSGTGSVHATFAVAGSRTVAASGKGARYVTFPETRSCASHSLTPSITGRGKRAKHIKKVTFLMNDTVVKQVRTPHQGQSVIVPVPDGVGGQVRAVVTLLPTRKGKPGKVVEMTAGYAPCT